MYRCRSCGAEFTGWTGRCRHCDAWAALEEVSRARGGPAGASVPLDDVDTEEVGRLPSGFAELDRVLGGGVVPGSCVLLGGEPGIGKSTLLLAVCARAAAPALYVAGEEAPAQIAVRARRLGLETGMLRLLDSTRTEEIAEVVCRERPALCVIDSVQTVVTEDATGAPGGPSQVRAAAEVLVPAARASGATLFLVGQMTKVGGLAGPRYLEHAVDTVLLFEGDRHASVRALRTTKNRYGATDEIGLFEMREDGLHEVRDASGLLLAAGFDAEPGRVVASVVEGRRPLCLEVQALVVGEKRVPARRRGQGLDARRLEVIVGAVDSNFPGKLGQRDVFVNVVGGLTVQDTGLDLAVAAAVLGVEWGAQVESDSVVVGEVGLRGEVRMVPHLPARLKEARAMGFSRAYVPRDSPTLEGIECIEVGRVNDVLCPFEPPAAAPREETEGEGGNGRNPDQ